MYNSEYESDMYAMGRPDRVIVYSFAALIWVALVGWWLAGLTMNVTVVAIIVGVSLATVLYAVAAGCSYRRNQRRACEGQRQQMLLEQRASLERQLYEPVWSRGRSQDYFGGVHPCEVDSSS